MDPDEIFHISKRIFTYISFPILHQRCEILKRGWGETEREMGGRYDNNRRIGLMDNFEDYSHWEGGRNIRPHSVKAALFS